MPDSTKQRIRSEMARLLYSEGLQATAKRTGLNRETVLRLAGGAGVRNGTFHAAAAALGIVPEARA